MKKFVRSLDFLNNQSIDSSFNFCVFLTKNHQLYKQKRFLCAVSGGQDSILCFFLLIHLGSKNDIFRNESDQTFYQNENFLYDVIAIKKQKSHVCLTPKTLESKSPFLTVIKQKKNLHFIMFIVIIFGNLKIFFVPNFYFNLVLLFTFHALLF